MKNKWKPSESGHECDSYIEGNAMGEKLKNVAQGKHAGPWLCHLLTFFLSPCFIAFLWYIHGQLMACHSAASIYGGQGSRVMKEKQQNQENGVMDLIWILLSAVRVMMMMWGPCEDLERVCMHTLVSIQTKWLNQNVIITRRHACIHKIKIYIEHT